MPFLPKILLSAEFGSKKARRNLKGEKNDKGGMKVVKNKL